MTPWMRVAFALFSIGFGANQFASLLQIYKRVDHLPQQAVTAMFAVYVAGLMPALLIAGWWSRHVGKRPFVRLALVAALVGSVLLAAGASSEPLLYLGRLVAGISAGAAMAPGTAWVSELSTDAPRGGARRAAIALSTGFALGPLAAGVAASGLLGPWPWGAKVLPYALHLGLGLLGLIWAWNVPELDASDQPTPAASEVVRAVASGWFVGRLGLTAPWVFGVAATSFVALPSAVAGSLAGWEALTTGVIACLTLGTGVLMQPTVRRLEGRHPKAVLPAGLGLVMLALALGIALVQTHALWLLVPSSVLFGLAYGTLLVGGLRTIETHVPPALLSPVNAVFYCLTYVGFTAPFVIAVVSSVLPIALTLAIGLAIAGLSLPVVWASGRWVRDAH